LANYDDKKAFKSLIKALSDPDDDVKKAAIESLDKVGNTRAITPIQSCIWNSRNYKLSEIGNAVIKRLKAVAAKRKNHQSIPKKSIVDSEIEKKRKEERELAKAKKRIEEWEEKKKIGKLIKALSEPDTNICVEAIHALRRIGGSKAVKPLLKIISEDSEKPISLRKAAIIALGEIRDEKSIEPLVCASKDKNLRIEAVYALSRIPRVEAREAIQQYAAEIAQVVEESEDVSEKLNAAYSLKFMSSPDTRIIYNKYLKTHIDGLFSEDKHMVNDAILVLGTLRDLSAVDPLIVVLNTGKRFAREFAATALGFIGGVEAKNALLGALQDLGPKPALSDWGLKSCIEGALQDIKKNKHNK
jgi:HEAT repeat protein